jgi:hypothetical protein
MLVISKPCGLPNSGEPLRHNSPKGPFDLQKVSFKHNNTEQTLKVLNNLLSWTMFDGQNVILVFKTILATKNCHVV